MHVQEYVYQGDCYFVIMITQEGSIVIKERF